MHVEALDVLPKLLTGSASAAEFCWPFDGASIAAIYAGGMQDHRVRAVVLMAPHVIVEDVSVALDRRDQDGYETTDLNPGSRAGTGCRQRLPNGWKRRLADPNFRRWIFPNISPISAYHRRHPGRRDQYGPSGQVEIVREECYCPVEVTILPEAGHSPHREAPGATAECDLGIPPTLCCERMRTHTDGSRDASTGMAG